MKLSIEIFPPKNGDTREIATSFLRAGASHISVTYGAGGSDQLLSKQESLSLAILGVPVTAHITVAGQTRQEVDEILSVWHRAGIRRFVALRGDGDGPGQPFTPHPDGYPSSIELIERIAQMGALQISVAAYPNGHPDSRSPDADLDFLKRKEDAGATEAITQFFFSADTYLRFRDRCAAAGIGLDFIPGIMPVFDFGKVASFARKCGEPIPSWVADRFDGLEEKPEMHYQVAAATAASLCERLASESVSRVHLYSCNRVDLTLAIARLITHPEPISKAA